LLVKQSSEFLISETDEEGKQNELEELFKFPTTENITKCITKFEKNNNHF